jgi:hypothetical protein
MNAYQMAEILEAFATITPVGDHTTIADLSSAVTLTPPAGATQVLIQALGQNVRYTVDGTTPTASVGFRMFTDTEPVIIRLASGEVLKLIQETASATAQYQWMAG